MNYRHAFHAGNHADVLKHIALVLILDRLRLKETPFGVLDTHAGIGRYDLAHEWAWKARKFESGIVKLWDRKDIPAALAPYMGGIDRLVP